LDQRIRTFASFEPLAAGVPELDIVVWKVAAQTAAQASARAEKIFAACAVQNLHLALVQLPLTWFEGGSVNAIISAPTVTCLRSVLMKPEHQAWLDEIWQRLAAATAEE
jgi:hypothetical protein